MVNDVLVETAMMQICCISHYENGEIAINGLWSVGSGYLTLHRM